MDEPLSNLDAKLRVQTRTEPRRLHDELGTTFLYVTHDQVEAMTLGDRAAVVHERKVQQVANPRELYAAPANTFVAGFVGSPPMNLLPTTLARNGHGARARVGSWVLDLPPVPVDDVVLGLRPEAFADPSTDGRPPGRAEQVLVKAVEPLGATVLLHFRLDGLDPVVFDTATGRRLLTVAQ